MTAWSSGAGPALIERLGWCLVHSVWQVAAVAVVAATRACADWNDRRPGSLSRRLRGAGGEWCSCR